MNVNATLIVQIFNFSIVYLMLRFFLFKPVIGIIEQEEMQENSLNDIIDQQKKSLEIQEKERQLNWYNCQEYFINQQPHIYHTSYLPSLISAEIDYNNNYAKESLPIDAITDTASKIRTVLEEKIKHVH